MRLATCSTAALLALMFPVLAFAQSTPDATAARSIAAAYNVTGDALMHQFATKPGNIVFSPTSIGLAMSMALHGARNATADEMQRVLSLTPDRISAASGGESQLIRILNGYDKSASPVTCPSSAQRVGDKCAIPIGANGRCGPLAEMKDGLCLTQGVRPASARLSIANALMVTLLGKAPILKSYTQDLARGYDAEVFQNATLDTVNGWVKQKTEGRIDRILDELSSHSVAVIVNAVYFKARWAATFSKKATRDEPFQLAPNANVRVPTMHQTDRFVVVAGEGYRAIRLPYTVSGLGMVIVLPNTVDGVDAIGAKLEAPAFSKLTANLQAAPAKLVDLSLPKFKITYATDLIPAFKALGLVQPFRSDAADFSGMADEAIYISQIQHRAVIDVDEDSTEAAAATAANFVSRGAPPMPEKPEVFRVDRPFLFYITDDATGAILFQGRISNPRGS
jgi:serpin B